MMAGFETLEGEQLLLFGCCCNPAFTAADGAAPDGCAESMIEDSFGSFPSWGGSELLYIIAAAAAIGLLLP